MSDWTANTRFADALRRRLPAPIYTLSRNLGAALLTPVLFSRRTGHFRSSLKSKSVDRSGKPIPWYTYPTVDFLEGKNFVGRTALEFGAGHSTLWWMRRAAEVVAIEGNAEWTAHLRPQVEGNVKLHQMTRPDEDLKPILGGRKFDMIVIDGVDGAGCDRAGSAQWVHNLDLLASGGAVLFDDSDGWCDQMGMVASIIGGFRDRGFSRVDFFGYAPAQLQWRCTSLFFKERCFLFEGQENPRKSE